MPDVDSPLLSANVSILLKKQFAKPGTLKMFIYFYLFFFRKENLQAAPTTAHDVHEGRGTLPSSRLHASNVSLRQQN